MSIKILGVGDAGSYFINRIHTSNIIVQYRTIILKTHASFPNLIHAHEAYLFMGAGLGTGGDPMRGRQIAEANKDFLFNLLAGTSKLIITAGMGGGTGTGASHVVAYVAKELRIPTIAIVSTPFSFEGTQRHKIAQLGVKALEKFADSVVVVRGDTVERYLAKQHLPAFKGISPPMSEIFIWMQHHVMHEIARQLDEGADSAWL